MYVDTENYMLDARLIAMPHAVEDLRALDDALAAAETGALTLAPEYHWLHPIVERFGGDTDEYLKWLIELREDRKRRPGACDATEMRHFVRSVYQRHTMRTRRRRLALAREVAALRDGKVLEGPQRAAFEARLLVSWIAQRDEWVAQAAHGKALSYAERIQLQNEFWDALDHKLETTRNLLQNTHMG